MNTLWTPNGGDEPGDRGPQPSADELAAAQEEMLRVRAELAATPVRDIVANHAIGLWQLAILHLGLDAGHDAAAAAGQASRPDLAEAKLAIDAMAALVEGTRDRLGDHVEALHAALTNLRLAYVRVNEELAEGAEDE